MMPLSELQGTWDVVKMNGEALPDSMENRPFFSLDITEKTLSGNAGCNQMNGKFKTLEQPSNSLVFLPISSTRMTCPNIETEFEIFSRSEGSNHFRHVTQRTRGTVCCRQCASTRTGQKKELIPIFSDDIVMMTDKATFLRFPISWRKGPCFS